MREGRKCECGGFAPLGVETVFVLAEPLARGRPDRRSARPVNEKQGGYGLTRVRHTLRSPCPMVKGRPAGFVSPIREKNADGMVCLKGGLHRVHDVGLRSAA